MSSPRYVLVCYDVNPSDGACLTQAWEPQAQIADFLPSHVEANVIGSAFFGALILVAFIKRTFKPQRNF